VRRAPDPEPVILAVTLALLVSAAGAVIAGSGPRSESVQASRQYQSLAGSLGLGPAVDLSHCAAVFDPRLASRCSREAGPLPGGSVFCPYHSLSIFSPTGETSAPSPAAAADARPR
jgi:hypothetical protein